MTKRLDHADIQGGILLNYGLAFPKNRYYFLRILDPKAGRDLVMALRPTITTAMPWPSSKENYCDKEKVEKPPVTLNVAFTFRGLLALGLPTRTLQRMPPEFIDGMPARATILGDGVNRNKPDGWDPIWAATARDPGNQVHVMVAIGAQMDPATGKPVPELDTVSKWLCDLCQKLGIQVIHGHRPDDLPYQDAAALMIQADGRYVAVPKEHFGFTDGFGDPVFEGQYEKDEADYVVGGGKIKPDGSWGTLATGEFLLGHPDEAQEIADSAMPWALSRNGTFMVYRKLHQNVGAFNGFIAKSAAQYAAMMGVAVDDAQAFIMASMVGRWQNGVPLLAAPTIAEWKAFKQPPLLGDKINPIFVNFRYSDDPSGIKCPIGAHMRRVNTRDMLDPHAFDPKNPTPRTSTLNNRRRILRRGLPYGAGSDDSGEHGVIFMALCTSLFRQFEFVQQQWLQYGLDFEAGNDTCPIVGNRRGDAKFVLPGNPATGTPPFILSEIPQFVETRGGDYFFMPSMTALRMIGMGTVDPT
jgi:Dyp-type peroxidase family